MAFSPAPSSPSRFKKKNIPDAAAYLFALSQADAHARGGQRSGTPTSTPALSFSSTITTTSADTLDEADIDNQNGLCFPVRSPTSEEVFTTVHTEFGHCANPDYRTTSAYTPGTSVTTPEVDPPYYILITTYISYLVLIVLGHVRDFFGKRLFPSYYTHLTPHDGYAALTSDFDSFYTRRLKQRLYECFEQPVAGVAGRTIVFKDRLSTDYNETQQYTGTYTRALNISSYNYLGFAQGQGGCADAVEETLHRYGIGAGGVRLEGGSSELHTLAEALVARFVGMEDSLISSMGFATNSTLIPALVNKGCLVISDELNHASIRWGVRSSGAQVRMFKHNDMNALEDLLREVISQGQPRTHRPWKKILIIVEGLYSMEGDMVNLPRIIELKKKYKFYLFVDEAHSIGALGAHGRGVTDYFSLDPRDIDILMGTFTKSFGAAGGYVSGKKAVIDRLRLRGYTGPYAEAMTAPVIMQVVATMASIMSVAHLRPVASLSPSSSTSTINPSGSQYADGYTHPGPAPASMFPPWFLALASSPELCTNVPLLSPSVTPSLDLSGVAGNDRIRRLAFNARYLSLGLRMLGFITYGHPNAPIVPLLLFHPAKMLLFHRLMLCRGVPKGGKTPTRRRGPICTVVVAYPATSLTTSRVRFCISAAHTKEDIDEVLRACDEIGDYLDLKHGLPPNERWTIDQVVANAVQLVNDPDLSPKL
ncbi:PLP-dependent transferase [Fistulina hepatica ATCC 64428]|nr:PLP-dependent transferase [Fistulina hepatica ATCC 64428]